MLRAIAVVFALLLALSILVPDGWTQGATSPDSENGRYTFKQVGDEMLRLDGRTGQVSTCSKRTAGWACLTVPDERSALETEITRLQTENAKLKKELVARGIPLPTGMSAPRADARPNEIVIKLPSEADLEKAMGVMENAWRRLLDMVQKMRPS